MRKGSIFKIVVGLTSKLMATKPQQRRKCDDDGKSGCCQERSKPLTQGRHTLVKNNQVCRVGDGENKAGGIGDEGAAEKVRKWFRSGFLYRSQDSGRQYDGRRVV